LEGGGEETESLAYSARAQAWTSTSRAVMALALRQLADWLWGLLVLDVVLEQIQGGGFILVSSADLKIDIGRESRCDGGRGREKGKEELLGIHGWLVVKYRSCVLGVIVIGRVVWLSEKCDGGLRISWDENWSLGWRPLYLGSIFLNSMLISLHLGVSSVKVDI